MRSRRFRIAFLLFLGLWFGIVVPGHQRGQLTLPGTSANLAYGGATISNASCCPANFKNSSQATAGNNAKETSGGTSGEKPTRSDQKRCAMCQYMATLLPPPPVLFVPTYQRLKIQRQYTEQNLCPTGLAIGSVPGRSPPHA